MQVTVILSALLVYRAAARQVDICYADDDDPYLFLATKTPYHFVHGGKTPFQVVPHCQPVQMWMLSRHGARYPSKEDVARLVALPKLREQIVHNHEHRSLGHLCNQDLDNLKLWNPDPKLTPEWSRRLTPQGAEDSKLFARRLQSNFPELLQPNLANITSDNFKFRSTSSQRTRSSMEAFMEGLFGSKNAVTPMEMPRGNDTLLKIYVNCTVWKDGNDGDPSSVEEHDKFLVGPEMTNVLQNISKRLGFQYTLSHDTVKSMFDMCRYEKAWMIAELSPWCAPFTKEELRVFEYSEDIDYYYAAGKGRRVNTRLGCPPLQDMFNHFKQLERGDTTDQPRGIFYFTHSVTFVSFLTSMGIAEDSEPLLASNYKQMARRHFRTSLISPFNANLVAVFYRCNEHERPNKVMFYLQEKPLLFEGCDVGLCDWEYLKNTLGDLAAECDPNFCWNGNGVSANRAWNIITLTILALLPVFSQWNRSNRDESG